MIQRRSHVAFWITLALICSLSTISAAYFAHADETTSADTGTTEVIEPAPTDTVVDTPDQTSGDAVVTTQSSDGQNGGDATSPTQTVTATSTDGTGGESSANGGSIVTGDATASTTAQNELNSNTASPDQEGQTNSSTVDSSTDNTGTLESAASSTAETGDNTAFGGQGTTTIVTGNAISTANVINLINTNIFNSVGLIVFLNQLFGTGLDLRDFNLSYFFDGQAGASPTVNAQGEPQCTLITCLNSSTMNVINTNDATVTNSVIVRASTGENTASSTDNGGAGIDTGDAYAAANVVNLVNTNIINSSYLLVAFNNFGNLAGDVTLPNSDFFAHLFAHGGSAPELNASTYDINNTNHAEFTGDTTATAATGDNMATTTGAGSGVISTGDAYSSANTYTDANSNYFGGTSVFLLFRVSGVWTGDVKGLPAGMKVLRAFEAYAEGDNVSTTTLVMITDALDEGVPQATNANCGGGGVPENNCFNSSAFTASSTNTALVDNSVDVSATTGDNLTVTEDGDGSIATGDAYAIANVMNLINTNVVGRNWIFALFNVVGDWEGDITFGKSNLALDAAAHAASPAIPGSEVSYAFTITNNGDADAEDVVLDADFDKSLLAFQDGAPTERGRTWNVGSIARGESRVVNAVAHVGDVPAGTSMTVPLTATVVSSGKNGAQAGASFTLATIQVAAPGSGGGGGGSSSRGSGGADDGKHSMDPLLTVKKSANTNAASASSTVDYKVVVTADKSAGAVYSGVLTDVLYDPSGAKMYERAWNLDTVAPGDQITLTYSVAYASTTLPGTYHNVARVTGYRGGPKNGNGIAITPVEGSWDIQLGQGSVLGAAMTGQNSCPPLLSSYMRRGARGADVARLQQFLNTSMGAGLPVTGFFAGMTESAVRTFQNTYRGDVLVPAGIAGPTGNVFALTLQKINALACGTPLAALSVPNTGAGFAAAPAKVKAAAPKALKASPKPAASNAGTASLPEPIKKEVVAPVASTSLGSWLRSVARNLWR